MNIIDAYPADIAGHVFPVDAGFIFEVTPSGQGVRFAAKKQGIEVASFRLTPLPGNHGILVFNAMQVAEDHKGCGYGTLTQQLVLEWGKRYQAAMLLCTTLSDNQPMRRVLTRYGWVEVGIESVNPRTGNHFSMWRRSY
jgi:RimJ/RimL family protein N-acetyltransferase